MPAIFGYVFSANFFFMWIRVATPIILVALGAVVCERSGVVNLGLEGTMLIAALFGVLGSHFGKGLLPGFFLGTGSALMISMIFAFFHLVLKANNVLCGTAINTLASGLTVFVLQMITGEKGTSASIKSYSYPEIHIPFLKDIPILGQILSGHNLLTYLAVLLLFVVMFLLFKTPLGLRIRAVGENPSAAASVGIPVVRIRFIAICICGVFAGLGGMYLSMAYLPIFARDMTAGRGFISLAACAMGRANPIGVFASALVFAFFDGLSNILQVLRIPAEFVQMMPYAATILGLTIYSIQRAYSLNLNHSRN